MHDAGGRTMINMMRRWRAMIYLMRWRGGQAMVCLMRRRGWLAMVCLM
jgi:hypothetical protein